MADHRRIRRLCASLDDAMRRLGDSGPAWMPGHVWQRLADLLQVHARAEEEICYLPMFACSPPATWRAAIDDHDDIREVISEASLHRAGSASWWRVVHAVIAASITHLDREERGILAHCLPGLTMSRRRELGRQWLSFIAAWTLDAAPGGQTGHLAGEPGRVSVPERRWRTVQG